jgi:hypothetical protein
VIEVLRHVDRRAQPEAASGELAPAAEARP